MEPQDSASILYKDEITRKLIHLCSLLIPVIYYFIPRETGIKALAFWVVFSLLIEAGRYFSPAFSKLFYSFFGFMLRKHERDGKKKNLTGATYVFISAFVCIILFPKLIFITAFTVLIISDTSAALFGRKFGRHKFLAKSFEGTLAFFLTACIVVLLAPKAQGAAMEYYIGFAAAAVGAIVENISYGWADDNLSIPLSIGAVMLALYTYLLPSINIWALR